jgi:hypothetical protein
MNRNFNRPDFFIPDNFKIGQDIEVWKPVPGFTTYEVSNLGRCRSKKQHKYFVPYKYPVGYQTYSLRCDLGIRQYILVHRLVALAFHENPNILKVVNHLDGNKQNNMPENLEWCSHSDNAKHAIRTGLNHVPKLKEDNHPQAILDRNKVVEILKLYYIANVSSQRISEIYNVDKSTICYIYKGKIWPDVYKLFKSQL